MGTGYTRNDTGNNIADGNVINAADLDGEFDAIESAFNASTGHSHDGTTGEGPQITSAGLAAGAVTSSAIANDSVALGTKTTGNYIATGAVSGVGLSGSASAEGATFTVTSNATDANTASTIVARDASGNFSAGTITNTGIATTGNITVSGTVDGRDVAADGTKLDGIESGATADQTASEILTAIKTVDGSGSGLDADLLDGQTGTYYLDANNFTNMPAGYTGWTVSDGSNSESIADGNTVTFSGSGASSVAYNTGTNTVTVSSTDTTYSNATTSAAGLMSSADKTKLDGVASGATANVGDITAVTAGSYITGGGTSGDVTVNVNADTANTASTVVARDASGNFSAGTITATLSGNATSATSASSVPWSGVTGAPTIYPNCTTAGAANCNNGTQLSGPRTAGQDQYQVTTIHSFYQSGTTHVILHNCNCNCRD